CEVPCERPSDSADPTGGVHHRCPPHLGAHHHHRTHGRCGRRPPHPPKEQPMTVFRVTNPNRGTYTYGHTIRLEVRSCPVCGIVYGIPEDFADALRRQGRPAHYSCPNGHNLGWSESEADRER